VNKYVVIQPYKPTLVTSSFHYINISNTLTILYLVSNYYQIEQHLITYLDIIIHVLAIWMLHWSRSYLWHMNRTMQTIQMSEMEVLEMYCLSSILLLSNNPLCWFHSRLDSLDGLDPTSLYNSLVVLSIQHWIDSVHQEVSIHSSPIPTLPWS